ncbi:5-hydroxytryptamine receptor 2A-like isoform X1 [Centruroides vittatus]|uniref:5-hydroxytryptamine receptor 2A-like isoform X1 n=3 Tax=Centruroides TaxID=6875 RepID=UPI00351005EA
MQNVLTYHSWKQINNDDDFQSEDVNVINSSSNIQKIINITEYVITYIVNGQTDNTIVVSSGIEMNSSITNLTEENILSIEPISYNWFFLLLSFFVLAGGLGNVLVCLAISTERRLQNVTNYFLMSLAIADLLVSVVVMPFGILDAIFGHWPFGWHLCNVWVACDVLSCSSSILHMCFISLGRYLGIRNPLIQRRSSKKMVFTKIALVWLLAMFITSPIIVLSLIDRTNVQATPNVCVINNQFFFVFGSLFAFYIPMFIMVTTYVLTVRLLQKKAMSLADRKDECSKAVRFSSSNGETGRHVDLRDYCTSQKFLLSREQFSKKSTRGSQYKPSGKMMRTQVMNEQKASTVLGIVFFTFVACWTPFFILNILFAVMDTNIFPDYLVTTFLWLGYVSSTINPIIYTIFNRTFKRAFWKLLTCNCHNTQRVTSC